MTETTLTPADYAAHDEAVAAQKVWHDRAAAEVAKVTVPMSKRQRAALENMVYRALREADYFGRYQVVKFDLKAEALHTCLLVTASVSLDKSIFDASIVGRIGPRGAQSGTIIPLLGKCREFKKKAY